MTEDKILKYMWFNVRNVGELREAIGLIPDNTKIDIDLRLVENITKKSKELQYNISYEPRNPETLK